jgi:hypothetical protein
MPRTLPHGLDEIGVAEWALCLGNLVLLTKCPRLGLGVLSAIAALLTATETAGKCQCGQNDVDQVYVSHGETPMQRVNFVWTTAVRTATIESRFRGRKETPGTSDAGRQSVQGKTGNEGLGSA